MGQIQDMGGGFELDPGGILMNTEGLMKVVWQMVYEPSDLMEIANYIFLEYRIELYSVAYLHDVYYQQIAKLLGFDASQFKLCEEVVSVSVYFMRLSAHLLSKELGLVREDFIRLILFNLDFTGLDMTEKATLNTYIQLSVIPK